jgi:hypothetical protein
MLHRINWDLSDEKKISIDDENNDKDNNSDSENEFTEEGTINSSKGENRCDLLWQGRVPKRIFHSFKSFFAVDVKICKYVNHYFRN